MHSAVSAERKLNARSGGNGTTDIPAKEPTLDFVRTQSFFQVILNQCCHIGYFNILCRQTHHAVLHRNLGSRPCLRGKLGLQWDIQSEIHRHIALQRNIIDKIPDLLPQW